MTQPPSPPSDDPPRTSRRGALRARGLQIPATYTMEGQRVTLRGIVLDLSATGALLLVAKPLPDGQALHVTFAVPQGPKIQAAATVARCKPAADNKHAAGIALTLSSDDEFALAQWVFEHV